MATVQDLNITGSLDLNQTTATTSSGGYLWWNYDQNAMIYSISGSSTNQL